MHVDEKYMEFDTGRVLDPASVVLGSSDQHCHASR
jgi:hypothetical protein